MDGRRAYAADQVLQRRGAQLLDLGLVHAGLVVGLGLLFGSAQALSGRVLYQNPGTNMAAISGLALGQGGVGGQGFGGGLLPNNRFMTSMFCSHRLLKVPQRDLPSGRGLLRLQPPQAYW